MRDQTIWSPDAWRVHKVVQSHRIAQQARFDLGPHFADDGYTLIVPSPYFHSKGWARFWGSRGFRWNDRYRDWERDTRRPYKGRTYSRRAWLRAARKAYSEFWPGWKPPERGK